jgi:carboxyl-terminal processing protease
VVKVTIKRNGLDKPVDIEIVRDEIPIYSIDASYMVTKSIGYIKINRFGAQTMDEYWSAFDKLVEEGMKSLIIDLRGNPGGYIGTAVDLADEFLSENEVILYTLGRKKPKEQFKATSDGNFETGRLAVLVDEGSASASEIVAGAIQDRDRGLIVGRRTFGKGLVQEPTMLSDGSSIRLTVSRYYTPSGRSIQRSYSKGVEAYYEEVDKRFSRGELMYKDSVKLDLTQKYLTSKGRTVYGGGGIMPDVFIPLDTLSLYESNLLLDYQNDINSFLIDYQQHQKVDLRRKYPTVVDLVKFFPPSQWNHFVEKCKEKYISNNKNKIRDVTLKHFLMTTLARQLYRTQGYFFVENQQDATLNEAVKSLNSNLYKQNKLRE